MACRAASTVPATVSDWVNVAGPATATSAAASIRVISAGLPSEALRSAVAVPAPSFNAPLFAAHRPPPPNTNSTAAPAMIQPDFFIDYERASAHPFYLVAQR